MQPPQPRPAVEIGVKTKNRLNFLAFHDGDRDCITSRKRGSMRCTLAGLQDIGSFDREDVVNNIQNQLKSRPNGLSRADGRVPVEDFLKHLGVRDQSLARGNQTLRQELSLGCVRMRPLR